MNYSHPAEIIVFQHKEFIRNIFEEIVKDGYREKCIKDFSLKVKSVVESLEINADVGFAESFEEFLKKHWKKKDFDEFCKILVGWIVHNKFQKFEFINLQEQYLKHLKEISAYYITLQKNSGPQDCDAIHKVNIKIKEKFKEFSRRYFFPSPVLVFRNEIFKIEKNSLSEIFKFYSVQHLFLGKFPTFQKINEQKQILDFGIFMLFCKQFEIIAIKSSTEGLRKESLKEIYYRNCNLNLNLDFQMFLQCFQEISVKFFTENQDFNSCLKFNQCNSDQKLILMLEKLKIGDLAYVRSKMKQISAPFSSRDNFSRFPPKTGEVIRKFEPEVMMKLKEFQLKKGKSKQKLLKRNQSCCASPEKKVFSRHHSAHYIHKSNDKISIHNESIVSDLITSASTNAISKPIKFVKFLKLKNC